MDWIGDVDGDGLDDFIVGANESDWLLSPDSGFALIHSGKDGTRIHSLLKWRERAIWNWKSWIGHRWPS